MQDFEVKYITSNAKAASIRGWLDSTLPSDGEYPEAIINSIYFDTKDLSYLYEKENSDHIKSKFRIRWYQDVNTKSVSDICFLEFKHKVGFVRSKKRIQTQNIFSFLPLESEKFNNSLLPLRVFNNKVLGHIFPSYIVSYTRKRYVVPETGQRVCIDYNINVTGVNSNLIPRNVREKYLYNCVFETKGQTQNFPRVCLPLEKMGLKKDAFSKYERCFEELIL